MLVCDNILVVEEQANPVSESVSVDSPARPSVENDASQREQSPSQSTMLQRRMKPHSVRLGTQRDVGSHSDASYRMTQVQHDIYEYGSYFSSTTNVKFLHVTRLSSAM